MKLIVFAPRAPTNSHTAQESTRQRRRDVFFSGKKVEGKGLRRTAKDDRERKMGWLWSRGG